MGANEDEPDDWLLQEMEERPAGKSTAIKEESGPRIELQEPGVSCLATLPPSSPPTISEAALTQRSPVVNTGTPAIPNRGQRGLRSAAT